MGVIRKKRDIKIEVYSDWDDKGLNYPIAPICIDGINWFHDTRSAITHLTGTLAKEMAEVLKGKGNES